MDFLKIFILNGKKNHSALKCSLQKVWWGDFYCWHFY